MVKFQGKTIAFLAVSLPLALWSSGSSAEADGFDRTMEMQGIGFRVICANDSSINQLRIEPRGLEIDNSVIQAETDGTVIGAEVADIDGNGSPEIYVYISSAGSGSYGSLVAYAVNNLKSMTAIYLPSLDDDPVASRGYMGHDLFQVEGDVLLRRFPVYLENDTNSKATGPTRQLEYKLVPGEAGWLLRLDSVTEF